MKQDIMRRVERVTCTAHQMGAAGMPCPLVTDITPTMPIEDAHLLVHAWTLRNFDREKYGADVIDEVDDFALMLVEKWQKGAREGQ